MLQKGWKEKQHFIWKEVKMPPQLPTMCCWYTTQGETTQSLHHYKFFRTLLFLFISLGERDHLWRAGLSIEHLIITWEFYSKARVDMLRKMSFCPPSTAFSTCETSSALWIAFERITGKVHSPWLSHLWRQNHGLNIWKAPVQLRARVGAAHSPLEVSQLFLKTDQRWADWTFFHQAIKSGSSFLLSDNEISFKPCAFPNMRKSTDFP